jgi:hypothetical protein
MNRRRGMEHRAYRSLAECQGYEDYGPYTVAEARRLMDETHPNCRCGLVPHLEEEDED